MAQSIDKIISPYTKELRLRSQPKFIPPMLATLTHHYFSNNNWVFERKLDGERCIAHKSGNKVKIYSRNKKLINKSYPEIVEAIAKQNQENFILDGEIVTFDKGITSFSKLQKRIHLKDPQKVMQTKIQVYYYVFDVLYFDHYDTTGLPLRTRKKLLKNIISFEGKVRYTIHKNTKGKELLKPACKKGWEGLIAKKASGKYVSKRSKDWLKFKCVNEQEFVIGGFTAPSGKRTGFGSLLLGYYDKDKLYYAGQVGTGFDDKTLATLRKKFSETEQKKTPFHKKDKLQGKRIHWIKPIMVCEVGFTEWTESGKLRHPRFLGIRRDKPAKEVIKEI